MAKNQPAILDLCPGTYYWCSCGKSGDLPFCDGSHAGTGKEPLKFTVEKDGKVALCACGKTAIPPYCDGSHDK